MSEQYLQIHVWKQFYHALLKILLFIVIFILCIVIGLFIGYSIIGDGNYWEVLNQNTWTHILDFFK